MKNTLRILKKWNTKDKLSAISYFSTECHFEKLFKIFTFPKWNHLYLIFYCLFIFSALEMVCKQLLIIQC